MGAAVPLDRGNPQVQDPEEERPEADFAADCGKGGEVAAVESCAQVLA